MLDRVADGETMPDAGENLTIMVLGKEHQRSSLDGTNQVKMGTSGTVGRLNGSPFDLNQKFRY